MEELKRRLSDSERDDLNASFSMCPAFMNHEDVLTIHKDLQEIKATLAEMREIVDAWKDAKGFIKTIRIIGEVLKWLVAIGATVGVIWFFFTGRGGK